MHIKLTSPEDFDQLIHRITSGEEEQKIKGSLDLSGNNFNRDMINRLVQALNYNPSITHLNLSSCRSIDAVCAQRLAETMYITHLSLNSTRIGYLNSNVSDGGTPEGCIALARNPNFTRLDLNCAGLNRSCHVDPVKEMMKNNNLLYLDIGDNGILYNDYAALLDAEIGNRLISLGLEKEYQDFPSNEGPLKKVRANQHKLKERLEAINFPSDNIPHEFRCPISLEIMTDPVKVSSGQTFDRQGLISWFAQNGMPLDTWTTNSTASCPLTRRPISKYELYSSPTSELILQIERFVSEEEKKVLSATVVSTVTTTNSQPPMEEKRFKL